jgi:hypothetical protein
MIVKFTIMQRKRRKRNQRSGEGYENAASDSGDYSGPAAEWFWKRLGI